MTAAKIRKLRVSLKMTQDQFAIKLGVSRRTMQGWETVKNRHRPSRMALAALKRLEEEIEASVLA